jgi:hypothetical protein
LGDHQYTSEGRVSIDRYSSYSVPQNNYCFSYEGKEKADVLNKYFCSIINLVDENKTLPDFDDRGGNVPENI